MVDALQMIRSLTLSLNSPLFVQTNEFRSTCIGIQHQLSLLKSLISPSSAEFALLLSAFIHIDIFLLGKTSEDVIKSKAYGELRQAAMEPRSLMDWRGMVMCWSGLVQWSVWLSDRIVNKKRYLAGCLSSFCEIGACGRLLGTAVLKWELKRRGITFFFSVIAIDSYSSTGSCAPLVLFLISWWFTERGMEEIAENDKHLK